MADSAPATAWTTVVSGSPGAAALRQHGVVFPVYVLGPSGSLKDSLGGPLAVQCMWDTGSDESSVDAGLLKALGVPQLGSVVISTVQGTETVPTDLATLTTAPGGFPLSGGALPVLADSLPSGTRVLIGRDIQSMYRLTVDAVAGTWRIEAPSASVTTPPTPLRAWLGPAIVLGLAAAVVGIAEAAG